MLVLVVGVAVLGMFPRTAAAAPGMVHDHAEQIRRLLFRAQTALAAGEIADAAQFTADAQAQYVERLSAAYQTDAAAVDFAIRQHFTLATEAAAQNRAVWFARWRAAVWAALLQGSAESAVATMGRGDVDGAARWLLLREFRTPTRFSRPGADATLALQGFREGRVSADHAQAVVRDDLLDTYQARLNEALGEVPQAHSRNLALRQAELAGLVAGYFEILADAYESLRSGEGLAQARTALMRFASGAAMGETAASTTEVVAVLKGFRAVPLSAEAQARRAGQFTRFIALVPVEYGRGVRDGKITNDIEVQEAVSFRDAAQAAYDDLYVTLAAINAPAADAIGAGLAAVEQQMRTVAAPADLEATVNDIARRFAALSPPEWQTIGGGSDLDVINAILDQIPVAVREGRYELAESARIEAYAVHDSGTEQRLLGYAPDLNARIELLFWGGTAERPGLATLLAARAPLPQISTALAQLRAELKEAEKLLSTKSAPEAVVGNAAVIVFREGLEAVLILASLLASLRTAETIKFRRPIIAGSVLALTATAATWWAANLLLMSLIRFGERLEAIVSLVAIGVLLMILNWFFHKVYWTGWIASFHQRKGRIIAGGLALSQVISLMVLGFSSIYREGFETVLFLQSLVLDAGLGTVLQGVAIGMAGVSVIGVITFALQVRLPYKKMLIVTGVMIGAVLLVMVGNTVHVLQVVGWLPITPISGLFFPHWMGQWFGLYATWQGIGFQIAAVVYVFGSYYWAESVNTPRRRRVQENAA